MCLCAHTEQWSTMQPQKEQNFAICGTVDGLREHYAKWSKSEEVWSHLYVESKKHSKLENITKKKHSHGYKNKLVVTSLRGKEGWAI